MELLEIAVDEGWEARAIRLPGDVWWTFARREDQERWALVLESARPPGGAELGQDAFVAKLAELFGATWDEIEEDPAEVFAFQARCQESIGPALTAKLDAASVEDVRAWRERVSSISSGEALLARIVGGDPLASRN